MDAIQAGDDLYPTMSSPIQDAIMEGGASSAIPLENDAHDTRGKNNSLKIHSGDNSLDMPDQHDSLDPITSCRVEGPPKGVSLLNTNKYMGQDMAAVQWAISNIANMDSVSDGTAERSWKSKSKTPVVSIFIHAGAGYHSLTNEKFHLEVCSDAARVAMRFLKSGAPAVEAVEAAIRCLEDKEITNAGYGSNLSMDGAVECDATIVDHLGRSGACGAVPNIRNPISLARVILETSSQPLSLRRVPPNILVGSGARDFASEHGMEAVPNEFLVSAMARERWNRWSEDLRRADGRNAGSASPSAPRNWLGATPGASSVQVPGELRYSSTEERRDHLNAIYTATYNEGQPDSPQQGPTTPRENGSPQQRAQLPSAMANASSNGPKTPTRSPLSFMKTGQHSPHSASPVSKRARFGATTGDGTVQSSSRPSDAPNGTGNHDGSSALGERETDMGNLIEIDDEDQITDTVGAIAIDQWGNIAAASSSGGIGMKHPGRIGPAALVGVGTAVIPQDPLDDELTSVAAITSGTGEHMATTMASHTCAHQLYSNYRRGVGGRMILENDEDALMESFVIDNFMNHPGVKNQMAQGAIGVMAVKKNRRGHYFHFAHNTDSFALASMSSHEKEPLVVMSRLGNGRTLSRGGRKISLD